MPRTKTKDLQLRVQSLSEQVVDLLGSRIVSGYFEAGETLPNEDDLATDLGVSRTVLREAIKILSNKGLLEVKTRVGTTILPRQAWNLLDPDVLAWNYGNGPSRSFLNNIVEVRRSIEVSAAELAAVRATEEDIEHIQEMYKALEAALDSNERYIEADMNFHEAIFKACHNELLEQLAVTLRLALKSSRQITVKRPSSSSDALPLHYAVVEAIVKHDAKAAGKATHKLIDRSVSDINMILDHVVAKTSA